ncbi:23S rRNA (uracil(1939)-C(5))-methyltransferase RlmD [bacterium BMS3Bbin06]|nr:23S rRNA (uracil(1939)-C(5))-methyltransferase RlmD [bacterium BMS3Abin08]GBE35203.1 23S rRNA (uracil(1939)-C(5))-methyltransferase RlmD [bacterium BMS3Bbin06]HDO35416.1 class I SAM-dependent RNA methyltransferase [Nitrospirota bacterium]HDY72177.1 class I SAM-dependent RNA methyltransferase [Nitrospirota bacterium]
MRFEASVPLYGGYVLSRREGVVFLKGALPGEVVEAEITEKKRDYSVAEVREVLEPSADRVSPACGVYGICGGCHYQHISYSGQVRVKEAVLRDVLKRIGKIEVNLDSSIVSEPWHYRKRVQFKVSKEGAVGFYRPLSHDVVQLKTCMLLSPELNVVLSRLKNSCLPVGVKELLLQCGDVLAARLYGKEVALDNAKADLGRAGVSVVPATGEGNNGDVGRMCLDLCGYHYMVTPGSFFQSNWSVNRKLVSVVASLVSALAPRRVLDLYAGAGNFSIPLSKYSAEVVAVEENPVSYGDAMENIRINGLENIKFHNRKVESLNIRGHVDVVVVDPPRTGISKGVMKKLQAVMPRWIFYISCNPATFARDLNRLSDIYDLESVRLVDMFPQTYHIETLGVLRSGQEK